MEIEKWNVFMLCILDLPGRSFHFFERTSHYNLHIRSTKPSCSSAAIHSSISTTDYNYSSAYFFNMAKSYTGKPVNSNVYILFGIPTAGKFGQILASWCTCSDKNSIIIFLKKLLHARYISVEHRMDTHIENIIHLLIQHLLRQPEGWDLATHKATSCHLFIVEVDLISEGGKVTCNSQRCRSGTYQSDFFAIRREWALGDTVT